MFVWTVESITDIYLLVELLIYYWLTKLRDHDA